MPLLLGKGTTQTKYIVSCLNALEELPNTHRQTPASTHTTTQQKMSSICFTGNGRRGCTPALLCMYLCPPPVHPPPICYMSVSTLHAGIQAYCILQFRYLLLNSKTHLYRRRNYNVYVHNTAILWTFVRCEQHLFRTTCFSFLPGWHAVVPGCSRLLMSLQHMVSLIVLNVVLIFRRVCGPEQLSLLARVPMSMSSCFRKSTWGKRMYIRLV